MALCSSSSHECAIINLGKKLDIIAMLISTKFPRYVLTIVKVLDFTTTNIWKQHEKIECHVLLSNYPFETHKACEYLMFNFNDDAVVENIGFLSYTTTTNMVYNVLLFYMYICTRS